MDVISRKKNLKWRLSKIEAHLSIFKYNSWEVALSAPVWVQVEGHSKVHSILGVTNFPSVQI